MGSGPSLNKDGLEELAQTMSVGEIAEHLGVAKSTIYYHMKKLGVARRDRRAAQKLHIDKHGHQREGSSHSEEARDKISRSARSFWDSERGEEQKEKLADLRREEWDNSSQRAKRQRLNKLRSAPRPEPGTLSKLGQALYEHLQDQGYKVDNCVSIVQDHVTDLVLKKEKIAIELILPVSVYGSEAEERLSLRYDRLASELKAMGYRMIIVEQKSNSISQARCQRVCDELAKFCKSSSRKRLTIES